MIALLGICDRVAPEYALGGLDRRSVETASGTRFDIRSRLGGHLHGDDLPAQDDCKAHGPWPGRKHRH